jgi:hypothetical protein
MATKNRRYVNSDKKGLTTVMYILVHDDDDDSVEEADTAVIELLINMLTCKQTSG